MDILQRTLYGPAQPLRQTRKPAVPYASDELVDHANKVLATGSYNAKYALLTTNAVLPPSGGIKLAEIGINAVNTPNLNQPGGPTFGTFVNNSYSKLKIDGAANTVKFIRMRANAKNEIGALTFTVKSPSDLPTVASRQGWTPVWWLPWQDRHIVKIKILDKTAHPTIAFGPNIDPVANPGLFFTAAINGCSVIAVGATTAPSMYHGGLDGSNMAPRGANETTEDAWQRLVGRLGGGKNVQGVGKSEYVAELDPTATDVNARFTVKDAKTTRDADNFEQNLMARGNLTNVSVSPFGMVFGLRDDGGNWSMVLVKNANISYRRISVVSKKRFLRSPKAVNVVSGEVRQARTYDAHGNLNASAVVSTTEQAFNHCVALGYKPFFPGLGAVKMHDFNSIMVF